jgi:hypothetical protein
LSRPFSRWCVNRAKVHLQARFFEPRATSSPDDDDDAAVGTGTRGQQASDRRPVGPAEAPAAPVHEVIRIRAIARGANRSGGRRHLASQENTGNSLSLAISPAHPSRRPPPESKRTADSRVGTRTHTREFSRDQSGALQRGPRATTGHLALPASLRPSLNRSGGCHAPARSAVDAQL